MGIRIHKCLGYGIDIVANNINWEEAFERLDENSKDDEVGELMMEEYARLKAINHRDAIHYSIWGPWKRDDSGGLVRVEDFPRHFLQMIHHASNMDCEGGWLVFQPPGCPAWTRFDDPIDWSEYHTGAEEPDYAPKVTLLPHPIYPFMGYQNAETGEKIELALWAPRKSANDVPYVPPSVRLVAEHTKICDWRKLRPVVATWWG